MKKRKTAQKRYSIQHHVQDKETKHDDIPRGKRRTPNLFLDSRSPGVHGNPRESMGIHGSPRESTGVQRKSTKIQRNDFEEIACLIPKSLKKPKYAVLLAKHCKIFEHLTIKWLGKVTGPTMKWRTHGPFLDSESFGLHDSRSWTPVVRKSAIFRIGLVAY